MYLRMTTDHAVFKSTTESSYGRGAKPRAVVGVEFAINMIPMLQFIVDNASCFSDDVWHEFARQVEYIDRQNTDHKYTKEHDQPEEEFKW